MITRENISLRKEIKNKLKEQGIQLHPRQTKQLNKLTFYIKDFRWEFINEDRLITINTYNHPCTIHESIRTL
jgi:ABC-type uncharacterized transport system substrate-binding protein